MVALHGDDLDDWNMEVDKEGLDFGKDGIGEFDWSKEDDSVPIALALMAKSDDSNNFLNSEVPYCSNCSKSYKLLLEHYQIEKDNFDRARVEIGEYIITVECLEKIIKTHEKNELVWGDHYEEMRDDLKMRDLKLSQANDELEQVKNERDELKEKLDKWSNAALIQTEILGKQKASTDKTCIGFGVEHSSNEESNNSSGGEKLTSPLYGKFIREKAYTAVPPPIGTILLPKPDLSFTVRNKI